MSQLTESKFLRDVENHSMIVLRDDGVYRHIRFSNKGSSVLYFDLITFPGCLCYTGDMGTYVFKRLNDMFEFFRTDRQKDDGKLYVNLGYWSEKLIAVDGNRRNGSAKEFSEDKFKQIINEFRIGWMRKRDLDKEQRRELWEAVEDEVLTVFGDAGGDVAMDAVYRFCWEPNCTSGRRRTWSFIDIFEYDFTEYTHGFLWCCFALAWGIKKYDEQKSLTTEKAA